MSEEISNQETLVTLQSKIQKAIYLEIFLIVFAILLVLLSIAATFFTWLEG